MEQCEYWWQQDDESPWCDLTSQACGCGGSNEQCGIKGRSILDSMRQTGKISLDDAWLRIQKRRHGFQEAS
jgi:hypothetical protein